MNNETKKEEKNTKKEKGDRMDFFIRKYLLFLWENIGGGGGVEVIGWMGGWINRKIETVHSAVSVSCFDIKYFTDQICETTKIDESKNIKLQFKASVSILKK